jgi:hypothetical protein
MDYSLVIFWRDFPVDRRKKSLPLPALNLPCRLFYESRIVYCPAGRRLRAPLALPLPLSSRPTLAHGGRQGGGKAGEGGYGGYSKGGQGNGSLGPRQASRVVGWRGNASYARTVPGAPPDLLPFFPLFDPEPHPFLARFHPLCLPPRQPRPTHYSHPHQGNRHANVVHWKPEA